VTRRIRRRGERAISRQTIAQGMSECSVCTCMLVCVFCTLFAHETAGAASTRHSLRPLNSGRMILQTSGASRRGIAECYPDETVIAATNAKRLRKGARRRSNPVLLFRSMDCFAEPVIGRRFAPTRWLAMTTLRSKSAWLFKLRTIRNKSLLQMSGDCVG
jgi:hypothetical protein